MDRKNEELGLSILSSLTVLIYKSLEFYFYLKKPKINGLALIGSIK
jgi:hypothetical protein